MRPGILLASGGLDSTVLAYRLADAGALREMFFVDYGQASAAEQLRLVKKHAGVLGVPHFRQRVLWPAYARGTGMLFTPGQAPEDPTQEELQGATPEDYERWLRQGFDFLPGRNSVFALYAAMRLVSVYATADVLYVGNQYDRGTWERGNPNERTDTSVAFVEALNTLFDSGAFLERLKVVAPFFDEKTDKSDILREAQVRGIRREDTYSCEFFPECGTCFACQNRARASLAGGGP